MIVLGALAAVVYGIYLVVKTVAEFVAANWVEVVIFLAVSTAGLVAGLIIWRVRAHRRDRSIRRFVEESNKLINDAESTVEAWKSLGPIRGRAEPIPADIMAQFPAAYRHMVATVVDDGHVDEEELARLDAAARTLGIRAEAVAEARRDGFLTVFRDAVSDGELTDEERVSLDQIREALCIPEAAVSSELALVGELAESQAVLRDSLPTVSTKVKLRKGEMCHFSTRATECKRRVAKSYVVGGERIREYEFKAARSGTLFITNKRVLFVAEGTTTVKHEAILDTKVAAEERLLVITKDGRKSPYYFETEKPHVTEAYVRKAISPTVDGSDH
jgi:hypothetical protein